MELQQDGARWERPENPVCEVPSYPPQAFSQLQGLVIQALQLPSIQDFGEARSPEHNRPFDQLRHDDQASNLRGTEALD